MAVIVEKVAELEYNEIITLNLIEKDVDLCSIFQEDIKLPFSMLYRMSKDNSLKQDIKDIVFELFDKVICCKKTYVDKYKRLQNAEPEIQETTQPVDQEIPTLETAPVVEPKPKKEKATPRRYGKVAIQEDIAKQGGRATNAQLTALAVNDLKNMWANLNARLVKDMLLEDKILTDEDYRDIRSTVKIVETKLKNVLRKK